MKIAAGNSATWKLKTVTTTQAHIQTHLNTQSEKKMKIEKITNIWEMEAENYCCKFVLYIGIEREC